MPNVDSLDIQIKAQANNAEKSLDSLINKLGKVSSSISGTSGKAKGLGSIGNGIGNITSSTTKATKSFKGLSSMIGKFYQRCFLAIRGVKALWKSIEGTADYLESFNYFEVALGKVGKDWSHQWEKYGYDSAEAYADSFKTRLQESISGLSGIQIQTDANGDGLLTSTGLKNLGLNIQEVTQYASQLASVTNSVGQTGEVTLAAASAFTKLGADMSSLFNLDYSSVMKNLQSGLIGQSRALYKYGIDITNATLQTYAFELGIEKQVSEMTQAEKMQLRMIAILKQSKVSWGDLANTISSPSNMIRQFKNNIKELSMVFGQLFIPVLQKVLPFVNGLTIAIKTLFTSIAGMFGIELKLSDFGQGYTDLGEDAEGATDGIEDLTNAMKKHKNATLGIDELNINSPQESGASSGIGGGIDLTEEIKNATAEYEKAWQEAFDNMEDVVQKWAARIEKALKPVKKLFEDISIGDWFAVGQDTSNIVTGIFDFFTRALEKVDWNGLGTKIGEFLKGVDWSSIFTSIGNFIETAISSAITLWEGSFSAEPIATAIVTALAAASFTGLSEVLKGKMITAITGITFTEAIALSIPISAFFKVQTKEGAEEYKKSIEKLNSFQFGKMNGKDLWNYIKSFGSATIGWDIGFFANQTLMEDYFKEPKKEDFESPVDYFIAKKEFENFQKEFLESYADMSWFSNWWNEHVKPWFTKELWSGIWKNVKESFIEEWLVIENTWQNTGIPTWWEEDVAPWFSKDKWSELWDDVQTSFSTGWQKVVDWWNTSDNSIKTWWNEDVEPWFDKDKWDFSGIKEGLSKAFDGAVEAIKGIWNSFATWLNEKLTINIDTSTLIGKGIAEVLGTSQIKLGQLPTFENGGFPQRADLFYANEFGVPELVGTVGGRTAVASGLEITGIKDEIRESSYQEMQLMREQNDLLRMILQKELNVNIGDKDIARANARGRKSLGVALIV